VLPAGEGKGSLGGGGGGRKDRASWGRGGGGRLEEIQATLWGLSAAGLNCKFGVALSCEDHAEWC
jgi:hypothetical protein